MGLGLGTRLGEYKSPEVRCGLLRRPYSSLSKDYNQISAWCVDLNSTSSNEQYYGGDFSVLEDGDVTPVTLQFNSNNVAHTRCLLSMNETAASDKVVSIYTHNSRLHACLTNDDHSTKVGKRNGSSLSNDTWYHVVAVFNTGASPSVVLYLNGSVETDSNTTAMVYRSGFGIGLVDGMDGSDTTDTYYVGKISQIAVWRGELNSGQIKSLYHEGNPRSPLGLMRGGLDRYTGGSGDALLLYMPMMKYGHTWPSNLPHINIANFNLSGAQETWRGLITQATAEKVIIRSMIGTNIDTSDYVEGFYGE